MTRAHATEDLTGSSLGRFRLEGVIGRGGMSTVYRATDTRLGRVVALKVIDPALAADEEFRDRFVDEARNTSAVDHPHVVPLYDVDSAELADAGPRLYIAMRFVEGPDLAALLGGGPLAPERTLRLLDQVADALDAVHAHGLVHLDVKPANVLVGGTTTGVEHAYLADFGLTHHGATGHRTRSGDFLGSPTYAAPEHLRGEPVDARTDVYSLGCVLHTCLSGRAPYRGSVTEVIAAHLAGDVPAVSGDPRGLGPDVDALLRRALATDPAPRPAGARELMADARAALTHHPARPLPDRSVPAAIVTTRPPGPVRPSSGGVPARPPVPPRTVPGPLRTQERSIPADRGAFGRDRPAVPPLGPVPAATLTALVVVAALVLLLVLVLG
ncbi:serine/threonine-protein kinase [Actinomycetospora atypica]|uniref:non-specific serine/threonine protein kinase n=1 Tax=Actinomycetospora atypica TaxID=1290095 RepID=A0ABV9YSJ6_9PSEU